MAWQAGDLVVLELEDKVPQAPGGRGIDLGTVSIEQALSTRTQNYVTIGGVVIVPPGVIGERNFWIQDANGFGARIYAAESAGALPTLKLYENVSVRGRVVSSFGAREIRVELPDGIGAYGRGEPIAPHELETGAVDFSSEGTLVSIQGFVARADGREIYVDDGSGEVLVYMDASMRIRWRKLKRGDPARIIGVVARFRGEPEILPRYQSDVKFGSAPQVVSERTGRAFLFKLRATGKVGEELAVMRRVRGEAQARIARGD